MFRLFGADSPQASQKDVIGLPPLVVGSAIWITCSQFFLAGAAEKASARPKAKGKARKTRRNGPLRVSGFALVDVGGGRFCQDMQPFCDSWSAN